MSTTYRPEDGLFAAIRAAGMPVPNTTIKYGAGVTRWSDTKGKGGKPYWLIAHPLNNGHIAATFGDWRTGIATTYKTWENGHPADPDEAQRLLDELTHRQKLADEEAASAKAATAKRELEIWDMLPEKGDSEYLNRKKAGPYGIRYGHDQYGKFIAVPMRDISGTFCAFQRIYEDGRKHFPKGAAKKCTYHLIGTLEPDGVLYLAEGYATAATVHEATGKAVAVCFDSGNLRAVADALKAVYPGLTLIMAADNDQWKADELDGQGKPKGNAGIKAAYAVAHAHPGTRVSIPNFENLDVSSKPTDFNDLAALTSFDNVRHQLERAKEPKPKESPKDESTMDNARLVLETINQGHAVVQHANRVLILTESMDPVLNRRAISFLSQADFRLKFSNQSVLVPTGKGVIPVSWSDLWLGHKDRRQYEGIVFVPTGTAPEGYFNLWNGLAVTPKAGDCSRLLEHIHAIICSGNDEKYNYLWNWCAHAVQRTNELPEIAPVLRSLPGTGKNTFVDALGAIFGRHYYPVTQNGLLCGRFTAHLVDAVLVFANEAAWGGDKQGEGRLKAMITDGIEMVEGKHRDAITIPNFKRIIVSSNENWAVPRGIGDRRFFCLDVSSKRIGDKAYFEAIHRELKAGGIEALLYELLATNLEGWHPRLSMPASNTDGEDMKVHSLGSTHKFWLHCLSIGKILTVGDEEHSYAADWQREVKKDQLHDGYLAWCNSHRVQRPDHFNLFMKELKEAVEFETGRPWGSGTDRQRVAVFPDLDTCRKQFQDKIARVDFDE